MNQNQANLIGHLTADVELQAGKSGKVFANGTIAVNKGNNIVDYIPVTFFDKVAETVSNYTKKGTKLRIFGTPKLETYEKDGVKNTIIKVVAKEIEFASSKDTNTVKNEKEQASQSNASVSNQDEQEAFFDGSEITDEEFPF